jgi:hypothetical protein
MKTDSVFFTAGLPSPPPAIVKIGRQKNPENQPLPIFIGRAIQEFIGLYDPSLKPAEEDFFVKNELPATNELEVVGKKSGQTYHIKLGGNQKIEYFAGKKHRGPGGIQLDESDVDEMMPREETPQDDFIDSVKKKAKNGDKFAKFFVKCLNRKK